MASVEIVLGVVSFFLPIWQYNKQNEQGFTKIFDFNWLGFFAGGGNRGGGEVFYSIILTIA